MSVKITKNLIDLSIRRIQSQLDRLPAEAYNFFVKVTPKDTGNARRKTKLVSKRTIDANYPYASRLDRGWSKQAPQGMTQPTERFIKQRLSKIIRK
jgi:hypothetical protein